ncbi:hypothetical protein KL86CLO1_11402 [uncultured Eubacteriales bacterium]|uniref:Uncharacterized protein n=1 Tax=uncultured Eubacteriales bacterium TaxID=172733 RepID=A0A212JN91_9FIRM|nr:hypothetical protein KL86CLO1_11402 [uncultured Eubacteriales bacterium]
MFTKCHFFTVSRAENKLIKKLYGLR